MSDSKPFCDDKDLAIIVEGNACLTETSIEICEVLSIEETQFIDQIGYDWTPEICSYEIGDQITFKNISNTAFWTVVDRVHYIAKEGVYASCEEHWHNSSIICQQNEVVRVSFVCDELGILDTINLELTTKTNTTIDSEPGEKRNVVGLWQDRAFTNVANFWINHYVGDDYYEQTWQSYHETYVLIGNTYNDVIKYEYGDHIHDDPHHRFYMEHGKGILAFEVENKLWIRE